MNIPYENTTGAAATSARRPTKFELSEAVLAYGAASENIVTEPRPIGAGSAYAEAQGRVLELIDAVFAGAPQVDAVQAAPEVPTQECWSSDEEDFNCDSLAELIDRAGNLKPGQTVWVGQSRHPEPHQLFDADDALEQMGERAYDIAFEHSDDYPNVTDAEKDELQALIVGWISKHAQPHFYTVVNIKPYVLTDADFAAPLAQPTDTTAGE